MHAFRTLIAGLSLTLTVATAQAQSSSSAAEHSYPPVSLGLSLGWGSPYGAGVDISYLVLPQLDVNAGVGFSITGTKIGVGTRFYFSPEHKISPFVGANLVHSGGFNKLNVTSNGNSSGGYGSSADKAVVNYKATNLLHLRGGVRWQPTYQFAMIGTLGYSAVLGDNPVEYVQEPNNQSTRDAVNIFSPGGVELSIGVALGLGCRN